MYRSRFQELKDNPDDPADFYHYLYQLEKDVCISEYVHHRENHNHLLKRVISCLREGHIPNFDLRSLRNALPNPNTGLTYKALTGKNKQSVPDCQRQPRTQALLPTPGAVAKTLVGLIQNSAGLIQNISWEGWHRSTFVAWEISKHFMFVFIIIYIYQKIWSQKIKKIHAANRHV